MVAEVVAMLRCCPRIEASCRRRNEQASLLRFQVDTYVAANRIKIVLEKLVELSEMIVVRYQIVTSYYILIFNPPGQLG